MGKKTLWLAGLILLVVARVNAQSIGLGPQVGYYKVQDADKGSTMGGAALRLKLMGLGVEAAINYRQEKYADGALTVRSWPIMVTGLFYPLPFIYGAVGAGWYRLTFDYDQSKLPLIQDETTKKMGWHFGGGVELPLGPVKLTGDIRYVFLDYDFKQIPGTGDMKSNFTVITVGLLFGL
jgi:opacity protein-like surface antigen